MITIKNNFMKLSLLFLFSLLLVLIGCKKKNDATSKDVIVRTESINAITINSATCTGSIVSDGAYLIKNKGMCWSTSPNPSISNSITDEGLGSGDFTSNLIGLADNTTYYVRAYAKIANTIIYGDEISFNTKKFTLAIGENYEGGIVFYIDNTNIHGYVVAPVDQGQFEWGCSGFFIGGTGSSIGVGSYNSNLINTTCQPFNGATRKCESLILNDKSDWYLPSKNELNLIYQNLYLKNLGSLSNGAYWSSTESSANNAWRQNFTLATPNQTIASKIDNNYVRAIRSF